MADYGRGNRAVAAAAQEMGFDEFMQYDPSGGGGGGAYFKWRDSNKGQADVWLHVKRPCVAFPNHNWPRIVEVKDKDTGVKELRVFSDRWGCMERKVVIENQYFRDRSTGERKYSPEVCPICLFAEHCFQQVFSGAWKATQPIFQFEGSRRDEYLVLTAGGICGWFTDKRFVEFPGLVRECKMAGLRRDEAWKQKLLTQKKFLFTVVDDRNVGNGVQTCFEGVALTKAVLKAIEDEKTKVRRMRNGNVDLADPSKHPYRFAWEYDGEQEINAMYSCVALRDGEAPPDDVLALITADPPDIAHLISEGDCYALRGQMEAHLVDGVEVPWDEIFGSAERAGKMSPPPETRADEDGGDGADGEDPGDFFDRKAEETAQVAKSESSSKAENEVAEFRKSASRVLLGDSPKSQAAPAADVSGTKPTASTDYEGAGLVDGPVVIASDSQIWAAAKRGGTIPFPAVKGVEVHLDAPEGAEDKVVDKVRAMLMKLGATAVAELVPCEHCDGQMTTLDSACPSCGAQVDEDGTLVSRPCLRDPHCKGQVPAVENPGVSSICPLCGTIHTMDAERGWLVPEPVKEKEAPAPRRGRRGAAPPFARSSGS